MAGFVPKYDWGEPNDAGAGTARGRAWQSGPAASGVHSFRFLDADQVGRGRAELHVRIRRRSGSITPTYVYFFADGDEGRAVYEAMLASPHPFTEVLVPRVIKAQVPYTRAG